MISRLWALTQPPFKFCSQLPFPSLCHALSRGCCSSRGGVTTISSMTLLNCCSSSYQGCGIHYSPGSGRPGVSIHSSEFWIGILWVGFYVVWQVVPTLCRTTSTSGHSRQLCTLSLFLLQASTLLCRGTQGEKRGFTSCGSVSV